MTTTHRHLAIAATGLRKSYGDKTVLDGIAVRSDKAYITESLMDPNAKLAKGFESLTISPMPPLGVLLKEQELADILAYLDTLKTPPKDGITVPVKKPTPYE